MNWPKTAITGSGNKLIERKSLGQTRSAKSGGQEKRKVECIAQNLADSRIYLSLTRISYCE